MSGLKDPAISPTNAKNHFGFISHVGGMRYFGSTKSSDFFMLFPKSTENKKSFLTFVA
ncbi:MAG: hypothetical protein J7L46_06690 [Bacteroidales bacterium]|nr:hypothetical protein [Bacteroidales bacterium]